LDVEVAEHLYTTDHFQESAFYAGHQIISIYYKVNALENISVRLSTIAFDFDEAQMNIYKEKNETESFRFIEWNEFSEESVTLPIDKIVVAMVKEKY
ncbi:MAG: NUDIX hydrolase, partial [Chitinophagaceae bacterium]